MKQKIIKLIIAIVICEMIGFLGSFFTQPAIADWYADLEKPSFNPPDWIFAPVWTFLYALMGISAYLIWIRGFEKTEVKIALVIFSIQLILNLLWSFLFFQLHSPFYAFIEIIVLWLFILLTAMSFLKIHRIAGFLLLPYLFWVTFAAILNFYIYRLN